MYGWLFQGSPLVVFPLIALVAFLGVFLAVLVRTLATRSGSYDGVAALPLDDDDAAVVTGPTTGVSHA